MAKWSINNKQGGADFKYVALDGRYLGQLLSIEEREVKNWDDPNVLDKKLLWVFGIVDKKIAPLGKDESATATLWTMPSMYRAEGGKSGQTSKMVKTLDAMSESGRIPETAMANPTAYQAYAESLIGQYFMLACTTKNGYATASPSWVSQGEIDRLLDHELAARGQVKYPTDHPKEQIDFKGYDDAPKTAPVAAVNGQQRYEYDLIALIGHDEKLNRAVGLLKQAGGSVDSKGLWHCVQDIAALSKYRRALTPSVVEPLSFDDDDIPF